MNIYHTCASLPDVERARQEAPSHRHGFAWLPVKMCAHDAPYIIDNGAYGAWKRGEEWSPDGFVARLEEVEQKMPRPPEWVVLPDEHRDDLVSLARSSRWAERVADYGLPYYLPVQDGMDVEAAVRAAVEVDAAGIFIGGSERFKRAHADQFVMTAHDYGLGCHIGKPGPSLSWCRDLGADSVDTSSIVRNGYWGRLRKLEAAPQTKERKLTEVSG
jgi:hypothetical protein